MAAHCGCPVPVGVSAPNVAHMKSNPIAKDKSGATPGTTTEVAPLPRLAYSVNETATIIGTAPITVRRLLTRGLLKSAPGLRTKLIPRTEIENFLRGGASE